MFFKVTVTDAFFLYVRTPKKTMPSKISTSGGLGETTPMSGETTTPPPGAASAQTSKTSMCVAALVVLGIVVIFACIWVLLTINGKVPCDRVGRWLGMAKYRMPVHPIERYGFGATEHGDQHGDQHGYQHDSRDEDDRVQDLLPEGSSAASHNYGRVNAPKTSCKQQRYGLRHEILPHKKDRGMLGQVGMASSIDCRMGESYEKRL